MIIAIYQACIYIRAIYLPHLYLFNVFIYLFSFSIPLFPNFILKYSSQRKQTSNHENKIVLDANARFQRREARRARHHSAIKVATGNEVIEQHTEEILALENQVEVMEKEEAEQEALALSSGGSFSYIYMYIFFTLNLF
jgi:hypothetical protein